MLDKAIAAFILLMILGGIGYVYWRFAPWW